MTSVIWTRKTLFAAHFVNELARQEPAHSEHVDRGAQSAIAEAIIALAETARAMVYWNFDQAKACILDQRGNETVHAFEWNERGDAFATHCFQGATGVAHAVLVDVAIERLQKSQIEELITTNSTPVRTVEGFKTTVLCVSELLGEGMKRIHNDESVSSLFKIDNDSN